MQYYQLVGLAAYIRDTRVIPEYRTGEGEAHMMGGFGNGMGSFGWLAMGVFLLVLVGLVVWLVARPRDRS